MNFSEEVNPLTFYAARDGFQILLELASFIPLIGHSPGSKELKVDGCGGWLYYASC